MNGGTGSFVCQISGYQKSIMQIMEWIEEPTGRTIKPYKRGDNYDDNYLINIIQSNKYWMSDNILYVQLTESTYQDRQYRCRVISLLTGQIFTSLTAGKLIVQLDQGNLFSLIRLNSQITSITKMYPINHKVFFLSLLFIFIFFFSFSSSSSSPSSLRL